MDAACSSILLLMLAWNADHAVSNSSPAAAERHRFFQPSTAFAPTTCALLHAVSKMFVDLSILSAARDEHSDTSGCRPIQPASDGKLTKKIN